MTHEMWPFFAAAVLIVVFGSMLFGSLISLWLVTRAEVRCEACRAAEARRVGP